MTEREQQSLQNLRSLLKLAYSAELAAAYAYRGHWYSVKDPDERKRIQQIENEELHHRRLVGEMLAQLGAQPSKARELWSAFLGGSLGVLCNLGSWLIPMYGAGRLESRNVREYEIAARYARSCGHPEFVESLLMMAEVEWEHEIYFRSRVSAHRWAARIPLWQSPPPKETIRSSFQNENTSTTGEAASIEPAPTIEYTGSH
jgi:rubrerythrin